MAGKSGNGSEKKLAKRSLKEKRAAKREKSEHTSLVKPRKGAAG